MNHGVLLDRVERLAYSKFEKKSMLDALDVFPIII